MFDALLDLGEEFEQLLAFGFLILLLGVVGCGQGLGQQGQAGLDLAQQLGLFEPQGRQCLSRRGFKLIAFGAQGRAGQGRAGTALIGVTATGQSGLRQGLGIGGLVGLGAGVDQDHFQWAGLKQAIKALRVSDAQAEQPAMHQQGHTQSDLQR